jgi:hypothetical protein
MAPELTTPVPLDAGYRVAGRDARSGDAAFIRTAAAAQAQAVPMIPAGHVALAVSARYGRDAPAISGGLIWRVYAAKPDANRCFPPPQGGQGGGADIRTAARQLCRHASLGLASAAKAVQLRTETVREVFRDSRRRNSA